VPERVKALDGSFVLDAHDSSLKVALRVCEACSNSESEASPWRGIFGPSPEVRKKTPHNLYLKPRLAHLGPPWGGVKGFCNPYLGSDKGGIGVYLFDEIDSGMSGQTAFEVGKKLKTVAKHSQVICITHLPQVAAFADHHLTVKKQVAGKKTSTEISDLNKQGRKEELARMLGGSSLTRKSLDNAAELLHMARP